jgi:hypothetical protein
MMEILRCSFCNKSQDEVRKLIAGPAVMICDECIEGCVDIIANDAAEDPEANSANAERLRSIAERFRRANAESCSLCGTRTLSVNLLPIENRGSLCGECADAVEDALARGQPRS